MTSTLGGKKRKVGGMSQITSAHSIAHPHYLMYKAAEFALARADVDEKLRSLHVATAYAMSAFALEAYVNDVCAVSIPEAVWGLVEKRLNTAEKIKLLEAYIPFSTDPSREPFQLLKPLFRIRDELAHCKRQVVEMESQALNEQPLVMPRAGFERRLDDVSLAKKLHKGVFDMVTILHNARVDKDQEVHPFESVAASHFFTIELTKVEG